MTRLVTVPFYWTIKITAWPIVRLYLRFRRRDKQNVPAAGPCIVVANHTSYLDAICLGSASPRRLEFLISWEIYRMRRLRWFYAMMGSIPLRTEGADTRALRRALETLKRGGAVGIFPEGQRMADGSLGEGKIGVAFLASRTGAPVIPAAIVGAHRSMPVGAVMPRPQRVQVVFGRPIFFPAVQQKAGREELNSFATRVMEEIARLSQRGAREEASSRALEESHR